MLRLRRAVRLTSACHRLASRESLSSSSSATVASTSLSLQHTILPHPASSSASCCRQYHHTILLRANAPNAASSTVASSSSSSSRTRDDLLHSIRTDFSFSRRVSACLQLHRHFNSTLTSSDYALLLRTLVDKGGPNDMKMLRVYTKEGLERGFLRDAELRLMWSVLKVIMEKGDTHDALSLFRHLQAMQKMDLAKIMRERFIQAGVTKLPDGQYLQSASADDVSTYALTLTPTSTPSSSIFSSTSATPPSYITLDRRIYHLLIEAYLRTGHIANAEDLVRVEMKKMAKIVELLGTNAVWCRNPVKPKGISARTAALLTAQTQAIQPSDILPVASTYLTIFRGAFSRGQYALAADMFTSAWNAAESDWMTKEKAVRVHLAKKRSGREEAAAAPPMSLVDMGEDVLQDLGLMLRMYRASNDALTIDQSDVPLVPSAHLLKPPPSIHSPLPLALRLESILAIWTSPEDIPSFLHITEEDQWRIQWTLNVLSRTQPTHTQVSHASLTSFPATTTKSPHPHIFDFLSRYMRSPTWMKYWFLGPLPQSQFDATLTLDPSPMPQYDQTMETVLPLQTSATPAHPSAPRSATPLPPTSPITQRTPVKYVDRELDLASKGQPPQRKFPTAGGSHRLSSASLSAMKDHSIAEAAESSALAELAPTLTTLVAPPPVPATVYSVPSPTDVLLQHPLATLELLFEWLYHQHAHSAITHLYEHAIRPAYEKANHKLVLKLAQSGSVELIDMPVTDTQKSTCRIRVKNESVVDSGAQSAIKVDKIYTVATVPPSEGAPLPPLSLFLHNILLDSYLRVPSPSATFFHILQERALIHVYASLTRMQEPILPGTLAELYASSAINTAEIAHLIRILPHQMWHLAQELKEQVFMQILRPKELMMIDVEKRKMKELAAMQQLAEGESPATTDFVAHDPSQPLTTWSSTLLTQRTHSIYTSLMHHYFCLRKYSALIALYEKDWNTRFTPSLTLDVNMSLYIIQSYLWIGNLDEGLKMMQEFLPSYSASQIVLLHAFIIHFLETHVIKSVRTAERRANISHSVFEPRQRTVYTPTGLLPLPIDVSVTNLSSMPILGKNSIPAFETSAGFTLLETIRTTEASSSSSHRRVLDDAVSDQRKINMWQRMMDQRQQAFYHQQDSRAKLTHEEERLVTAMFDDIEFLQSPLAFRPRVHLPSPSSSSAHHGLRHIRAPQGGHISFGQSSPALSSYATQSSILSSSHHPHSSKSQRKKHPQLVLDPLVNYQLAHISRLLENLISSHASALSYDPRSRVCDLRAGVSYHRGRCIMYLLSLYIKSHSDSSQPQTYEFILPRSGLRQSDDPSQATSVVDRILKQQSEMSYHGEVSELESIQFQSYTAEFLLAQYFPDEYTTRVVEPQQRRASLSSASSSWPLAQGRMTEAQQATQDDRTDAFGRPLREQDYVTFMVRWP